MIKINFCGDFKCNDVKNLKLDKSIRDLLNKGDVNIINFEAPIKAGAIIPIKKDGPNNFQDNDSPGFLRAADFNLFSLANNHIMDYGEEGFARTKECFKEGEFLGAGTWREAYRPVLKVINGIKVGFLALCHHEFGVLQEEVYCANVSGAAWMLHPCVDEIIVNTKKECDYLFLFIHAGYENEFYPLPEYRTLYKHFIHMGVDGVIACHPHTPQPWEIYQGKPIFYSLGNFCFESQKESNPYWNWSILLSLSIKDNKDIIVEEHYCYFDKRMKKISMLDDDLFFNQHIGELNQVFCELDAYRDEIYKICKKHDNRYYKAFLKLALCNMSKINILKSFLLFILNRVKGSNAFVLNTIRCESHRWLLSQSLEDGI